MRPAAKVNKEVRQSIITLHSTNEPFQNKVCKVCFGEHGPLTYTLYILLCVISWGGRGGGGGGTHYNELQCTCGFCAPKDYVFRTEVYKKICSDFTS